MGSLAQNYIEQIMNTYNYHDTNGTIIMDNGMAIAVRNSFELLKREWLLYKYLIKNKRKKALKEFNKETGGVLTNGEVSVDIDKVYTMIANYGILPAQEGTSDSS